MMTRQECENRQWPHANRCRYTDGFYCEDCGEFFHKESAGYIRYELPADISLVVHNIGCDYHRAGQAEPKVISELEAQLDMVKGEESQTVRERILNRALWFIAAHGKTPNSATLPIGG